MVVFLGYTVLYFRLDHKKLLKIEKYDSKLQILFGYVNNTENYWVNGNSNYTKILCKKTSQNLNKNSNC